MFSVHCDRRLPVPPRSPVHSSRFVRRAPRNPGHSPSGGNDYRRGTGHWRRIVGGPSSAWMERAESAPMAAARRMARDLRRRLRIRR